MKRRHMVPLLLAALFVGGAISLSGVRPALGQDPTIPTRTPTPDPNAPATAQPTVVPTNPPPGSGGEQPTAVPPPVDPGAAATETAVPSAPGTATATAVPLPQATDTADPAVPAEVPAVDGSSSPCDDRPYARAIEPLNVLAGPGANYAILTVLQSGDIRPIIGRAAYATWWQIQVDETLLGWVPDEQVEESGNTGSVPLVEPPAMNGIVPTPGVAWEPTPLPFTPCEPTAVPNETPSPMPTTAADEPAATPTEAVVVMADISSEPNEAAGVSIALPDEAAVEVVAPAAATASRAPLSQYILPVVGLTLVAAGIGLAVFSRRPPSAGKR